MIETDGPFLTPRDLKGKPQDGRNERLSYHTFCKLYHGV